MGEGGGQCVFYDPIICAMQYSILSKNLKKEERGQDCPESEVRGQDCPLSEVRDQDCPLSGVRCQDCPLSEVRERSGLSTVRG